MLRRKSEKHAVSRRAMLKSLGLAPLLLRPAPLFGSSLFFQSAAATPDRHEAFPFSDVRLTPHYPAKSPLEDLLRLVEPGSDDYVTEKYALQIQRHLEEWGGALKSSTTDLSLLARMTDSALEASSLVPVEEAPLRGGNGIDITRRKFGSAEASGRDHFLVDMGHWLALISQVETAEFEVTSIDEISSGPLTVNVDVRYDFVARRKDGQREERVGAWRMRWSQSATQSWTIRRWEAADETLCVVRGRFFEDVTNEALGGTESYENQLLYGADHWRTVLDGACGIDVYGNNGVAAGDFDNDGYDDLYICQPAGLPNLLYRNRGDGTFEDVTEKAGVGVLEGTACALFADFQNRGLQDLLVVCSNGPLLFVNQGNGTFSLKRDAFQFAKAPQGSFTHAALADYDRDGRLDIYFCVYSYYLGLDQYHYPVPYYDARNGPPNFLMHNQGDGSFVDRTEAAGLNVENDRYSFACAWGEAGSSGMPDLYVANDFGRNNLYRNNGNGTFAAASTAAHAQDVGAGMSACWADFDNDGRQDIYVSNMWSSAGQRVSQQKHFHEKAAEEIRANYRRHARGNALYRNQGDGTFENVSLQAGVEVGRWAWCSDFLDFDHDGYSDLYIANGYITAPVSTGKTDAERSELGSFFWRQVVAKSPEDSTPTLAYEHGWNALNELIRSDNSWSGLERNLMLANNRDGTFSEVSGAVGLDFVEDSRAFALADIDHDGRLEVILKNRNAPQVRILHNQSEALGHSIAFRLRGTTSNRDAIGAAVTVVTGTLRQTKFLQAGSGFLAQNSKQVFFGLGTASLPVRASVRWPSEVTEEFEALPINACIAITEGSATFSAQPFSDTATAYANPHPSRASKPMPVEIETWLIEPLKAPAFSLPDPEGTLHTLQESQGRFVLLTFWAMPAASSLELLNSLAKHQSELAAVGLKILAINVDEEGKREEALAFAARDKLPFPALFASADVAGVYNIIYRYLFDRRRDLPIPASFLVDRNGMIVKLYQGSVNPDRLRMDVDAAPANAVNRLQKALPRGGVLFEGAFLRNDFTYGVAMYQHGYFDEAAASFQQVIAAKPDNAEGYYNLGTLNLRRNNFAQARNYLQQTLKLRPDYPEAWNNLGMMAAQEGSADEAIADFQQALVLRPGYATALLNLGNVYRRQRSYDNAHKSLQQAFDIQPDDPEINYSLGMFYAQQEQMQRASDFLNRAIALRPDYPEAINNLGVLFVREHNYPEAEQQFQSSIRVAPAFDQSYINLSRLYALQKNPAKARSVLEDLLRLQPHNQSALRAMEMLNAAP